MLKNFLILLILSFIVGCFSLKYEAPDPNNIRIIELAPGVRVKVSEPDTHKILAEGTRFMDVTNHLEKSVANFSNIAYPSGPQYEMYIKNQLFPMIDLDDAMDSILELSKLQTRYYKTDTGVDATDEIIQSYKSRAAGYGRAVQIESVVHPQFSEWQESFIASIPGSDPQFADEIVIIGAHLDSVTWPLYLSRSPGADDDGSGTASVFGVFNVLMESNFTPKRTIEFHGYAAEEVGLLGSQDIAQMYATEGKNVYAMLNLDMTAYPSASGTDKIGITTDGTDPDLSQFLRTLVSTYTSCTPFDTQCGYGCSDFDSWTASGFPSCFPQESGNYRQIHTSNDKIENLNKDYMKNFIQLGIAYMVELGMPSN